MCRFLAYSGEPVFLSDLVCAPTHSLVHQSLHADEGKTETNGDGFGIGWYGERPEPGVYRDISPAWSDENLVNLCGQVRARTFFAHVRAATGTATARANCHPFAHGRHLFMHNGQIGGYCRIKRRLEALIPDDLYDSWKKFNNSAKRFPLLGFVFDDSKVKNEIAQLTAIGNEYKVIGTGAVDNPSKLLDERNAKLKAAGIEKVQAELQTQIDAWWKDNKK